jgi:hypothetical protein
MPQQGSRLGHKVWIALQGYGLVAAGLWTCIVHGHIAIGSGLMAVGLGAHDWSRDLVFRLLEHFHPRKRG